MKTIVKFFGLMMLLFVVPSIFAQEMTLQDFMDEADQNLKSKNYREAVNSLQMAINEINKLMIDQVRESMPTEVDGYKAKEGDDESSGTSAMGMFGGGLSVERNYYKSPNDWDNYFKLSVMGNSPLLASVNMMLSNSMYLSGTGNKVIKIGTRKGLLSDEGDGAFKFQLPLSNSLISIDGYGFASSGDFMKIVNGIGMEKLAAALGE
nr:hypothetical protein [Bacteroidota bacterium]